MAKWLLNEDCSDLKNFKLPVHPVVARILSSRGLKNEAEIEKFIFSEYESDAHDPFLFADMEKVVERIGWARDRKEKVAIFGDYDADGITSSAIIKETLDNIGIDCFVYIPDKKSEGYSMNGEAVDNFKKNGVKLIITVDCGITSISEVEKANAYGIDVIITDHHHVPQALPRAYAIINPHAENCAYPFKDLAGVGVAFKVVQALYKTFLAQSLEQTKWMLDLVAIGTIADCVPLVGENRLFVKYGLVVLSKTRRVGLKELFVVGRIMIDERTVPDAKKVSFYIAPRINAAGRINHANLAYDLVVENDAVRARGFALELEANNSERQRITEKVAEEVRVSAQNMYKDRKFIFAVGEHFPVGVIGLVAGKIAQQFNKPTAIFQKTDEISKGSFRSIPQINIIETIGKCSELLVRYGGHSQAAGVSVKNENLEKFYKKMDALISEQLEGVDLSEEIKVDSVLTSSDIDIDLVDGLEKMQPFGEGNPEPVFMMRNLVVREKRNLGNGNKHIKLFLTPSDGSPKMFEAISFNGYDKFAHIQQEDRVDILCHVQNDEWNGNKRIQFMLVDAKKI